MCLGQNLKEKKKIRPCNLNWMSHGYLKCLYRNAVSNGVMLELYL